MKLVLKLVKMAGAYILEYYPSPPSLEGGNFSNQFTLERESKRCWKSAASFGDILHTYCYQNSKNTQLSSTLSLYFSNFNFPAFYLHSFTLGLKNLKFYAENMGKKTKKYNVSSWDKISKSILLYTEFCPFKRQNSNLDLTQTYIFFGDCHVEPVNIKP